MSDSNRKKVDFLNVDPEIPGQKFVCLSFLTPTKEEQTSLLGMKVRGVFDDYDTACKKAKELQEMDPAFHVFVGEVGKWLPYDPDPESKYVKSSEYANDELNNIMKNYLVNQEKAKVFHEKRKYEMSRKNLEENLGKLSKQYSDTQKKMKKTTGSMKVTLGKRMKTMAKRIAELENRIEHNKKEEDKYLEEMKSLDNSKGTPQMNLEAPRDVEIKSSKPVEENTNE